MNRSRQLYERACKVIPGGVNSPVRAFRAVGGIPFFVERAEGSRLWTVDGQELIDFVATWGPAIAGHANPHILEAINRAAKKGTSFGMPHEIEIEMAERIVRSYPSIEMVRMCNSGTEACMSAIRLARGFTGRDRIIKFAGCYHGHADYLLVKAGSGALTFGHPDSAGVPYDFAKHTIVLPFNDAEAVRKVFEEQGDQIAAVILEPITGNAGVFVVDVEFLKVLRELTERFGAILIFDEVMTGFRVGPAGAQGRFGIRPDLTCLGKIIGGGLPVGAFGGRADIMGRLAPEGPVYQAGTLSGNPVALAAGLAALDLLDSPQVYERLQTMTSRMILGLQNAAEKAGLKVQVQGYCSMFSLFFAEQPVRNLDDAMKSRTDLFRSFFHGMLKRGIFFPPSPFEASFISLAHSEEDVNRTVAAAAEVFQDLAKQV